MKAETLKNPILGNVHIVQGNILIEKYPILALVKNLNIISLWKYIESRPHKFFSFPAMNIFLQELENIDKNHHFDLRHFLSEEMGRIDNIFRNIEEINSFNWHDKPLRDKNDYRNLMLINQNLNPAYLRLVEAVLTPLLRIPAYFSRVGRNKSIAKLDLYNISIELAGTELNKLLTPYDPLVRNGIAHGGVTYGEDSIFFNDKRGNLKEFKCDEIMKLFDDLLDICNGMVFAISCFLLKQKDSEYPCPNHVRLEELRAETNTPYWQVVGWLPAERVNFSQLIVYVEVNTLDYQKALFSSFQTAILAERLSPGYDRYFLSLNQPKGWRGFGAFIGKHLAHHRRQGHEIDKYSDVFEDTGLFFVPRMKLPKLIRKLGSLRLAFRVEMPLVVAAYRKRTGLRNVIVRHTELHRNSWGAVLNADVVLESSNDQISQEDVRRQCRVIIRKSLRKARHERSYSSLLRYLPLGYARVRVFQKDFRCRKLENFGLASDLVGTIQVKRINRIKAPDITGSTIEYARRVRIAWNRHWMENKTTADDGII